MRSDEVCLREMISATEQLLELLAKPDTERLLKEDRGFWHAVFFEFVVIGERCRGSLRNYGKGIPESHGVRSALFETESRIAVSN